VLLAEQSAGALVSSLSSSGSGDDEETAFDSGLDEQLDDADELNHLDEVYTGDEERERAVDPSTAHGAISASRSACALIRGERCSPAGPAASSLVGASKSQNDMVHSAPVVDPHLLLDGLPDALQCLMNLSFSGRGVKLSSEVEC
jgi:hypothetical protein